MKLSISSARNIRMPLAFMKRQTGAGGGHDRREIGASRMSGQLPSILSSISLTAAVYLLVTELNGQPRHRSREQIVSSVS
ncbi:hypothetical protein CCR75_006726 [Bremia lactucae]|uniref:Uncharacterized protein n=1 Tax=Bremia lactucae TaxID=4779 RepID=A0A976IKK4_BRELC|nr:hypothetical protein CCR75_006726 [Bremia lactucae]